MLKHYQLRNYDFKLIVLVIAITSIGILVIGSADEAFQDKQILGFVMGCFLMIFLSLFDYSFFLRFYWLIYVFNLILLLSVEFFGKNVNGATRWLEVAGIQFQPSETAKIMLILFFSMYIMKYQYDLNSFHRLLSIGLLLAPPLLLIYEQPDLSTSISIIIIICVLLFIGGLSFKIVGGIFAIVIPTATLFLSMVVKPDQTLINEYQQKRILGWLYPEQYPDIHYQQGNSIMGIGSGQLYGKGLNNTDIESVKNSNYIVEPQTDFIFSIVGEELGFIGGCAVILLLMLITIECLLVARNAKDLAGTLIASGIASLIGFQSFINISVATGLLPNTGIPLPFVSYGLTSLVSILIGIGFVINIRLQSDKKY